MNIPKLRFKEFSGEWEEKKLGDIGKVSMCKRIMKDQTSLVGDIPFYKIGTFGKKPDAYISKEIYIEYRNKYSFPKKGDILLSASGTIGRTVIYNGEPSYFQDSNIVWIANNEKIILNSFLFQLYKNIRWTTEDTTIARLYNDNLSSMCVFISTLEEQQKIADFLSSVDRKISIVDEKLNLFKEYKKGMMQKIFSQKIRFKDSDGNDYPEWEEKNFQQLVLLQRGSSPRPIVKYITTSSDGVNWIKIGDTNKENRFITSTSEKITKEGAKKSREVKKGEIILSNSMSYGRPFILKIDGYIHDGWFVLRNYEENLNKEFLCQLLGSEIVQKQYKKLAAGGVVENISSELVNAVNIQLPCLEEQQKIADFLSGIDNKIDNLASELKNLKEFKKGLLQQMFV